MRKLDAIIDAAGIKAGDRVLEIGCGWGAFAIRAAQRTGCHVTGLTLSKEQLAEATARVKELGLSDKVTLLFCDYRDCKGAPPPPPPPPPPAPPAPAHLPRKAARRAQSSSRVVDKKRVAALSPCCASPPRCACRRRVVRRGGQHRDD